MAKGQMRSTKEKKKPKNKDKVKPVSAYKASFGAPAGGAAFSAPGSGKK